MGRSIAANTRARNTAASDSIASGAADMWSLARRRVSSTNCSTISGSNLAAP
ncbi:MAG: hypothetical protein IRZ08_21840 [Frankia sp.]|nr:hypothetical protein [Frankia sp.]